MLLLLFTLLTSPARAATAPNIQITSPAQILRHSLDSGCVNPGGSCTPCAFPCCGQDTACFRGRCVVIEEMKAIDSKRDGR